jgi:single-strand DNA-binding protein
MASVNKVILIGNLGRDPEIRSSQNGGKIASLNIATTEFRKDSKTGSSAEHTEWHRISIFGKLSDVAEQYLKKGSPVFIEGRIRTNKWTDKAGIERYGVEVICENLQLLAGRPQALNDGNTEVTSSNDRFSQNLSRDAGSSSSIDFDEDIIPF